MDPVLTFAGLVVGIVVGMLGVGGGALMTPFLIAYGVTPAIAVGTDLAYALFSKTAGACLHHRLANVRWRIVILLALGSLPASWGCTWLLGRFAEIGADYQGLIRGTVSLTLTMSAVAMLWGKVGNNRDRSIGNDGGSSDFRREGAVVLVGGMLGLLVTLTSIGSGAVCAVALVWLYPRLPAVAVVGTDLAHAVPLIATALIGHWWLGNVDIGLLASLIPGAIPGVILGAELGSRLPERIMRCYLATALLAASVLAVGGLL